MRFLAFLPFFRTRRAKTFRIRRIQPAQPALAITFHTAAALTVLGLVTGVFVLLGPDGGAAILNQARTVANPALLAVLLSANTCTLLFALNHNAH